jgi:hypothetical protein
MLDIFYLVVKAPITADIAALTTATTALAAASVGLVFTRKKFRKMRRRLLWSSFKDRLSGLRRERGPKGCGLFLVGLLLLIVLAILSWKLALIGLAVLLMIWLIRGMTRGDR